MTFCLPTWHFHENNNSTQRYFLVQPDEIAMLTANDFNLKTIQPLIDYDISGVLNGNVAIQEIYQSALINSDVKIDRFMFEKQL
jgi:hypothetical protein